MKDCKGFIVFNLAFLSRLSIPYDRVDVPPGSAEWRIFDVKRVMARSHRMPSRLRAPPLPTRTLCLIGRRLPIQRARVPGQPRARSARRATPRARNSLRRLKGMPSFRNDRHSWNLGLHEVVRLATSASAICSLGSSGVALLAGGVWLCANPYPITSKATAPCRDHTGG